MAGRPARVPGERAYEGFLDRDFPVPRHHPGLRSPADSSREEGHIHPALRGDRSDWGVCSQGSHRARPATDNGGRGCPPRLRPPRSSPTGTGSVHPGIRVEPTPVPPRPGRMETARRIELSDRFGIQSSTGRLAGGTGTEGHPPLERCSLDRSAVASLAPWRIHPASERGQPLPEALRSGHHSPWLWRRHQRIGQPPLLG